MNAVHRACHGCLDGCKRESAVHCTSCVNEPWPCDASVLSRYLMSAASDAHVFRRHQPHGSSFLDCDHTICQEHRAALGLPLHGYTPSTADGSSASPSPSAERRAGGRGMRAGTNMGEGRKS